MIGCGDRGRTAHMQGICKHLTATNFEIVALAPDNRTVTRRAFDLNRWEDYSFLEANLLGSVETGFVKHQAALVSVSNPLAP